MNLPLVRDFIREGDLKYALELVEAEKFEKLSSIEQLEYIDLKSQIFHQQKEYQKILLTADLLSDKHATDNPEVFIEIILRKVSALYGLSNYKETSDLVDVGLKIIESNQILDLSFNKIRLLQHKGKANTQLGNYEDARKIHLNALEIAEKEQNREELAEVLNNLGNVDYFRGKLNSAKDYYERSVRVREELGDNKEIAVSLNNLGVLYSDIGDLNQALAYYMKSMNIYKEFNLKGDLADSYNNLGVLYADKGEVEIALNYYEKSLQIKQEIGNQSGIATSLNNIGLIFQMMGKYRKAKEYFLQALVIDEEIDNKMHVADDYYNLVTICLDLNQKESVDEFLEKLKFLEKQEQNVRISQRYRIAKALNLKISNRIQLKSQAQQLLKEVIEETISDYTITSFAMLNLCDLLIEELQMYGDLEVFIEVRQLTEKLHGMAKSKLSHSLLGEVFLLQSKLALIDLDITEAQQLLVQAQLSCEEKGLQKLAMKASAHHDFLLGQMSKWEELIENNASIQERLKYTKIDDLMNAVLRKKVEKLEVKHEEPILILLLSKSGTSILSKAFSQLASSDQLIGGFLTAINSFMGTIFNEKGSIDRILYQDYTVLIKPKGSVLFCYAFKGQSYTALKNLNQFIRLSKESGSFWKGINKEVIRISKEDEYIFEKHVKDAFL
ncbi:MAG: tetratricopeptide repeat protein [Candidatus Kariarchaeaceae archaeon]